MRNGAGIGRTFQLLPSGSFCQEVFWVGRENNFLSGGGGAENRNFLSSSGQNVPVALAPRSLAEGVLDQWCKLCKSIMARS